MLHHLLDSYNVLERPVANESDPLQLSFGLTLMQIIDVVSVENIIFAFQYGEQIEGFYLYQADPQKFIQDSSPH